VPFSPGGSTDLLARQIADRIAGPLGQPIVVENRPAAGGTVGASYVAKSKPDGYTLLMGVTGSNAINAVLRDDLPYNPVTDFSAVSIVISAPLVLVVNAQRDIKTTQDYINVAKAKPDTLTHGTPGVGTSMHLTGELFGLESHTKLLHVPYKGSAGAVQDLLGGRLDSMFGDILVTAEYVKSGHLRALAVTSAQRHVMLPDVPTVAEGGMPGFQALSWQGVFAPSGTPKPVLARLHAEIAKVLRADDVQKFFSDRGFVVESRAPDESQAFVEAEVRRWKRVVDEAGLKTK
jgi:tripartite-type tricarboxylate transporter receptor subunit TctC